MIKEKYDVVIIGAGPAGLFSAYELIEKNPKLRVLIVDKGRVAKTRNCPMRSTGVCCNCQPCSILCGFGGAGTFSDGKLNFTPKIGKSDLFKYMSKEEAYNIIDETEKIFNKFGMDDEVYPKSTEKSHEYEKKVALCGAYLMLIKQKHLGSDKLPKYIDDFTNYLANKNVDILDLASVDDIEKQKDGTYNIIFENKEKHKTINSKYVVIAPGRIGASWIDGFVKKHNLSFKSQSIEVGVRVEVRKEILEDITNEIYDPSIFIKTNTFSDEIRTFCTNPGGFVAKENYFGFICVNGHALKDIKSNNSNFAFITKITLTQPATNTRLYGESIARIANVLGNNKPIIQTLKDLRRGRRSEWNRINQGFLQPTLRDCVAGDLSLVLPHRVITNIIEGLDKLNEIIPGVGNDETLLYGPEIKFFCNEIDTDNHFKIKDENLYFIGDGAGKSGNIVTAAATGLIASRDILSSVSQTYDAK